MSKYPGSVLSRGADSDMKVGPLSADGSVEPIASTSKGSALLLLTGVKRTSQVPKPPVQRKGVGVPSSMDKEKGLEVEGSTFGDERGERGPFSRLVFHAGFP